MRRGARGDVLLLASVLAGLSAFVWMAYRPRPSLEGVDHLIASKRFDEAEGRLISYLVSVPDDDLARLLLARTSVYRLDPKPGQALEHLPRIRVVDPRLGAEVKSIEGEAHLLLRRFDAAETAWLEAIRLDPRIPEVGWGLLNLYALQGREEEARRLGLRLFMVEPDPHDRIQLLLQLIRHDAHAISAGSVVNQLEPVVRENPADLHSSLALGLALVREGRPDQGLKLLREAVESHRDRADVRDAYFSGLVDAGRVDELSRSLQELPGSLSEDPRFDVARGWLASQRGDGLAATRAYRRAWEARPGDPILSYRLQSALRVVGRQEECDALSARLADAATSGDTLRTLYDQIDALPDLGRVPHLDLYLQVAVVLEKIGRLDEAAAWRRIAGAD